jgi:hypothetical protein
VRPFKLGSTTAALLGLCLLLAGVLALELGAGPYRPPDESAVAGEPPAPEVNVDLVAVTPPEQATYDEVLSRPLFVRGRQPPSEQPADLVEAPVAQDMADVRLEGIIVTEDKRVALARIQSENRLERVFEGSTFRGWDVTAIRPDRVVLRQDEREHELPLLKDRAAEGVVPGMQGVVPGMQPGVAQPRPMPPRAAIPRPPPRPAAPRPATPRPANPGMPGAVLRPGTPGQ